MAQNKTSQRINFASIKNRLDYPDFLDIQLKSFNDFLKIGSSAEKRTKEGLYSVFNDNFPISDSRNNFVLEFLDYAIDPPRYTIEECIQRGLTFKPGNGIGVGKDYTLFAIKEGMVKFEQSGKNKFVHVY